MSLPSGLLGATHPRNPIADLAVMPSQRVRGPDSLRTKSELMRDQAARLLALSTQAREAGNSDLAELLAQAAANCLANIVTEELDNPSPPQSPEPAQQPVAQQQQQIQPLKEEDEQGS